MKPRTVPASVALMVVALVAACSSSSSGTSAATGVTSAGSSTGTTGPGRTTGTTGNGATNSSTSAGSSGSSSGAATSGGTATGSAAGTSGTGGSPVYSLSFPAITVPAGGELTQCVVLSLGNAAAVHIGEIHNLLPAGAFDFVVYRSSDSQAQPTPFSCPTFSNLGAASPDSALILSNKADDDMLLPAGVGLTLQPNQLLRLELHAVNGEQTSAQVSASSTLYAMADTAFQSEAAFVFLGDADITLDPGSAGSAAGFVVPAGAAMAAAQFSRLSGYTHSLGTMVTVETGPSGAGPLTTVYDPSSWMWNDSPRLDAQPPAQLPRDGGFEITCDYNNQTQNTVMHGTSSMNEACFFQAYAHPASGALVCLHTDKIPGGFDQCCPQGDAGCSVFQ
jgi:hypothetical protein